MKPGHRIEKTKGQRHRSPQTHSKNRKSSTKSVDSTTHHAQNLRKKNDEGELFLEGLKKKRLAWLKKTRIDPASLKDLVAVTHVSRNMVRGPILTTVVISDLRPHTNHGHVLENSVITDVARPAVHL